MISLIVVHDLNRVIGHMNKMPWHIPNELAYFKEKTMGKAIIMGRNTFESIGRPLPGRLNIVVTRNESYKPEGVTVVHTLKEAIALASDFHEEVMVIGGEQIFKESLPLADKLYVTVIENEFVGDTFFPPYENEWVVSSRSEEMITDKGLRYTYQILHRNTSVESV
ncbi:MAG: dihydrofolate reductase [Paenisporosarcina sp.]